MNLDADLIFIKNIDNVVVYKYEEQVADYKKVLAGLLLEIQEQNFEYLEKLDHQILQMKRNLRKLHNF